MAAGAADLVDHILPVIADYRQWTLSFPRWLRIRLLRDSVNRFGPCRSPGCRRRAEKLHRPAYPLAHELICGRRLFLADSDLQTVTNIREKPIPPPSRLNPEVPRDLDDVVITALQRDPDLRWQNAAAMRAALIGVADRLGRVSGADIRAWVEWAFTREPWRDSSLNGLLDDWEPTRTVEPGDGASLREVTPTVPSPRPIEMPAGRRVPPWLVLLLVATVLGAAGWLGWLDVVVAQR